MPVPPTLAIWSALCLPPSPGWRRWPRLRASALGAVHARVHPPRYGAGAPLSSASRRAWAVSAQPWHTRASSTRFIRR